MARTGMAVMIETVRGFCNAGSADVVLGTATFWADDEVQRVLDRHKTYIVREELTPFESYAGSGTIVYLEYRSAFGNIESGTAGSFKIENGPGATIGTSAYTGDYVNGVFTFGTNTAGTAYFMTGYSYDVYAAAADIWRVKSGHVASGVNFSTDNMRVDRGQLIKNCQSMAEYYGRMSGAKVFNFTRDDSTIFGSAEREY
jgi:hypothetical protein